MKRSRVINHIVISLSLLFFSNAALAQSEKNNQSRQSLTPAVTASVTAGDVRFASPERVLQMRLEIYNAAGEIVFDSGLRQGSILDWKVTDATRAMIDGTYLCTVTVMDFQGQLRQRVGAVSLQAGQLTLKRLGQGELTPAQSQTLSARRQSQKVEAEDDNASLTILREGKDRSVVVAAHDGRDGQITSTKGALTFRTGDAFSNRAKEQMRITPEGRVGVGTDNPEATLDVAGTIRARGGIVFDDGTVLNSAGVGVSPVAGLRPSVTAKGANMTNGVENIAGTGTQNKIARWTDNSGTLGDSSITDLNGLIGVGTATPQSTFNVNQTSANNNSKGLFLSGDEYLQSGNGTPQTGLLMLLGVNRPGNRQLWVGDRDNLGSATAGFFRIHTSGIFNSMDAVSGNGLNRLPLNLGTATSNVGVGFGDFTAAPGSKLSVAGSVSVGNSFKSTVAPAEGMIVQGNVGIGTDSPANKLDVVGNIKLVGAGNGLIFPDGSKMTTATIGNGSTPSGNSLVAAINDPGTTSIINDNRFSTNIPRLGSANAWAGPNVFNLGLSAGGAQVSNVGNPSAAGDAVNKAFFDAKAVQFVPAAEQLSVGDANGTAPMINLRGGSTCCSGPGGHTPAFFKVFQNGSFVATGNLGIGSSPMEGKGYRTSWHTYKGAFRSGYADNEWDDANVGFFSWAGGSNSTASGLYAFAFGDTNFARSTSSIAFGSGNEVKGAAGFSAGAGNRVCDTYGVALGNNARSGGPYIDGKCDPETFNIRGLAAVAIGYNVTADQDHTMALGKFASNNGFQGTFIWSDGAPQASADTFRNVANNEFAVRATGGVRFRTNLGGTTGCNLPAGSGVFNCTSSRYTKENFSLVNGADVLSRLRNVPVSTWNYISEGNKVRHMGPMAEDFYQAFGLGTGNTAIGVQDLAGVSLAAIQSLDQRTTELQKKSAEVEQLRTQVGELRSLNVALEQRLAALEQKASKKTQGKAKGRRG